VHQIRVERYVKFNKDVWRVECGLCGIAADDLGINDAAQVASVLKRRMCGAVVAGRGEDLSRDGLHDLPLSDLQIVAMWAHQKPSDERGNVAINAMRDGDAD
jgi:hypothetical protein